MSSEKGECLIRDVRLRNGNLGPILVTFEHGKLNTNEPSNLKCGLFTPSDNSKICTVAAVAEEGDVVYQGDIQQEDGELCHTFLAIRNKRNNKMRIFEASSVRLKPSVASNYVDQLVPLNPKQAHYDLFQAFGSKKNKRIADQKARMEVNADFVKDKLSSTVQDISINMDLSAPVEDDTFTKLLPPCNREASKPEDIYSISGILTDKEIRSLEKFHQNSIETKTTEKPKFSPFYEHMITKVSPVNTRHAALLLYAEALLRFCNMSPKQLSQKAVLCPFSDKINKKMLKEFTIPDGRQITKPQSMSDKAAMYVIILSLHISSFTVDLDFIASNIKFLDRARIRTLARFIGTRPASLLPGTPKTLVKLSAPLPDMKILVKAHSKRT